MWQSRGFVWLADCRAVHRAFGHRSLRATSLEEDGVYNGSNIWQYHVWCTASGVANTCTWRGYNYNGGGSPKYAMQFGENSCVGAVLNGAQVCIGHGQRRWINDNGTLGELHILVTDSTRGRS